MTPPEGWALVPIEPTEEMLVAGLCNVDPIGKLVDWDPVKNPGATREAARGLYAGMIATAPKPETL